MEASSITVTDKVDDEEMQNDDREKEDEARPGSGAGGVSNHHSSSDEDDDDDDLMDFRLPMGSSNNNTWKPAAPTIQVPVVEDAILACLDMAVQSHDRMVLSDATAWVLPPPAVVPLAAATATASVDDNDETILPPTAAPDKDDDNPSFVLADWKPAELKLPAWLGEGRAEEEDEQS